MGFMGDWMEISIERKRWGQRTEIGFSEENWRRFRTGDVGWDRRFYLGWVIFR